MYIYFYFLKRQIVIGYNTYHSYSPRQKFNPGSSDARVPMNSSDLDKYSGTPSKFPVLRITSTSLARATK